MTTRTYKMGFSNMPPQMTTASVLGNLAHWKSRAELAIIHDEPPWAQLLAGVNPDTLVQQNYVPIVGDFRAAGLQVVFVGDMTDGSDRSKDADQLVSLGRSLTEPVVQQLFRNYMLSVQKLLKPDVFVIGVETNAVRLVASASLYAALKTTAAATASDLRAVGYSGAFGTSIQVEVAWGAYQANKFVGIAQDLIDFPYAAILGLSSYPYEVYKNPGQIPATYYSALTNKRAFAFVEGGWCSATPGSSEAMQAAYITTNAALLDSVNAIGWMQLLYADTSAGALPSNIASLGMAHSDWSSKPAGTQWDALFKRKGV